MHRWDKSRTRVKAKDVLYFNPEMYTPSHVAYPGDTHPITNCAEDSCINKLYVKADNLF